MSSTIGIWCDRLARDGSTCDQYVGHLKIGAGGVEGMSGLDTAASGIIGTPRGERHPPRRPSLEGPSATFSERVAAWDRAHGPIHSRYQFVCGRCDFTVPMKAEKLDEVARYIHEHPVEMITTGGLVVVNGVPHLKLSALRAMLSKI